VWYRGPDDIGVIKRELQLPDNCEDGPWLSLRRIVRSQDDSIVANRIPVGTREPTTGDFFRQRREELTGQECRVEAKCSLWRAAKITGGRLYSPELKARGKDESLADITMNIMFLNIHA
jgi:hypothetical protein